MDWIYSRKKEVFWVSYFIYFVATVFQTTMFNDNPAAFRVFVIARYLSFLGVMLKLCLDFCSQYMLDCRSDRKKWSLSSPCVLFLIRIFCIMLFAVIVSFTADERSLIFLFGFLLAANDIPVKKIFRVTLILQVSMMVLIMLSASLNLIPDLLFERDGQYIRHALGYIYPSVTMTYFYFIVLLYAATIEHQMNGRELFVLLAFDFLLYELTDARMGFLITAAVLVILFLSGQNKITKLFVQKNHFQKAVAALRTVGIHLYDYLAVYLSVLLAVLYYGRFTVIVNKIDMLLTGRIWLFANAVEKYGVHVLGNRIEWIGYGGNTDLQSFEGIYNFVDCSYGSLLLNYGVLLYAGIMVLLVMTAKRIRKAKAYRLCFLYASVLLYCFVEPRLIELQTNTFLFLLVPVLFSVPTKPGRPGKMDKAEA